LCSAAAKIVLAYNTTAACLAVAATKAVCSTTCSL